MLRTRGDSTFMPDRYTMHKDQFHYWVVKDLITLNKGDYKNYWNRWMPDILE